MRVLFDQGTPVPLRRSLASHIVATVFERGWSTLQNGELLRAAEDEGVRGLGHYRSESEVSTESEVSSNRCYCTHDYQLAPD